MPFSVEPMRRALTKMQRELDDYAELAKDHSEYNSQNRARLQDVTASLSWAAIQVENALNSLKNWKKKE